MTGAIADYLRRWLDAGGGCLGQVLVSPAFSLRHVEDAGKTDLTLHANPHDAMLIARYDDSGNYRPLKTAPTLRHGWRLELVSLDELRLALDFLYPAALGLAAAKAGNKLFPVPLRETLSRQTGMYAVVKKIRTDSAGHLIETFCRGNPGCLRHILWGIDSNTKPPARQTADAMPLLCAEACNLFIAAGRRVVKSEQ